MVLVPLPLPLPPTRTLLPVVQGVVILLKGCLDGHHHTAAGRATGTSCMWEAAVLRNHQPDCSTQTGRCAGMANNHVFSNLSALSPSPPATAPHVRSLVSGRDDLQHFHQSREPQVR
jgi:hypothetical protein